MENFSTLPLTFPQSNVELNLLKSLLLKIMKKLALLFILIMTLFELQAQSVNCNSTLADEYHALMTLYQATNGSGWTNNNGWRDADPNVVQSVSGWYGVQVDNTGHLLQLNLGSNNLVGSIPAAIGDLCSATHLYLYLNSLTGSIPAEIGNLINLQVLHISGNHLTGSIPSSIGNLSNLQALVLNGNSLSGLPSSMGNLTSLTSLYLSGNLFTGEIPPWIGNLSNLIFLHLFDNKFTSIPSEIGGLVSLQELYIYNNSLVGGIPSEIGNLTQIRNINLSVNHLTGDIPASIGNLSKLEGLALAGNSLSGVIPSSFSNLMSLNSLHLEANLLSGNIPSSIGSLSNLSAFHFYNNNFTFSNLLPLKQNFTGSTFFYNPQNLIDDKKAITAAIGQALTLTASVDHDTNPQSVFQWFKVVNGVVTSFPAETNGYTHTISNFTQSDTAHYYYTITNPDVPSLLLTSRMQIVSSIGFDYRLGAVLLTDLNNWSSADAAYSNVGATGTGFNEEPGVGAHNVWFKFQATTSEVDLRVLFSGLKGTLPGASVRLFNDTGEEIASTVSWVSFSYIQYLNLNPGSLYYISVDGDEGTFTLQINDHIGNDNREKAILIGNTDDWTSSDAEFNNINATGAGFSGNAYENHHNVWFKFQAVTKEIDIRVLSGGLKGTMPYPSLRLYNETGEVIGGFQSGADPATIGTYERTYTQNLSLTPGVTYYFSVDDDNSPQGSFTLQIKNHIDYDHRLKAKFLDNTTSWTSSDAEFSNIGATGAGFNSIWGVNPNVWFAFQARTNEIKMNVLTGGTKGTLVDGLITLFDSNGNVLISNYSPVQYLSLTTDSTYYFSVSSPAQGTFTLEVDDEITNNFISHAQLIPDIQSWTSEDGAYSNVNATPDFNGSPCGGPFHNVWYKFQATESNLEILATSGGSKGTLQYPLITLFDSDSLAVGCNGGFQRALIDSITVTPGNWYYLSVDNYQGDPGTFTLQIKNNSDNIPIGCTPTRADEYHALMALYAATNGASWTNNTGWRDANPGVVQNFQDWYGISVNTEGHIVALNLAANNLIGKIPTSIGNLRALNTLLLDNNQLNGEIPSEMGNLSCLGVLGLSNNQLTGLIPLSFGDLANLSTLDISHNNLNGIITTVIGGLHSLTMLNLQSNSFTGQIPPSLGRLTNLTFLDLGSNQLQGGIPDSLSHLTALTSLRLGSNSLTGIIPPLLGNLTQLQDMDLHLNQLTSAIPAELGNLHDLNTLLLQNNQLSGTVPDAFSQLTSMNKLDLSNNTLTGEVDFISGLVGLTDLIIHDNFFTGGIASLNQLSNLQTLSAANNQFTSISADILGLPALHSVILDNNALITVPDFSAQVNRADLELTITQNYLTFTQLLPFINTEFRSLSYSPQKPIDNEKFVKAAVGQPLVLTTSIDRETSPSSIFQWLKLINGVESTLNSSSIDGHTFTIPAMTQSDDGTQYYYKISNPSSELVLTSKLQTFQTVICAQLSLDFQFERLDGKYSFTPALSATDQVCNVSYTWDFGDGTTSTESNPNHIYDAGGNYTINLNVSYTCEGCATTSISAQHQITIDQSFCSVLYCDGNGIGIGTTQIPSGYKLAVKGKVIMEGAKVLLQTKWPDYVFDKEYKMMEIQKLKEYIETHSHLPNVPSAETVKKEGIDIGDMNALLLKKIEELTLYMIQLDDQVKKLEIDK